MSELPELAELDIDIDLQIRLHPENTNYDQWFHNQAYHLYSKRGELAVAGKAYGGSFTAQLLLLDESGNTVGYSNLYNFTNSVQVQPLSGRSVSVTPNPDNWRDYVAIEPNSSVTTQAFASMSIRSLISAKTVFNPPASGLSNTASAPI